MFRAVSSALCPFCEAWSSRTSRGPSWQTSRSAATLQKRRPSRMVLYDKVARGPPKQSLETGRAVRRTRPSQAGPFNGMNQTTPPRSTQVQRNKISTAEHKRQTRMAPDKVKDKEVVKQPMKALKMQRALASVSYERRGRVKQEIQDRTDFGDFGLLTVVKDSISTQALGGLVNVSPTPIQRLAIAALLGNDDGRTRRRASNDLAARDEMKSFLLAAETGSGKTLAYVLPVVDAIKRAETMEHEQGWDQSNTFHELPYRRQRREFELDGPQSDPETTGGRPSAIILLPTMELVTQVGTVLKKLSHTIRFRTAIISAAYSSTVIRNRLFSPGGVDVVVSTPHLLSSITESDPDVLSRVSHLVIDEADSLLDRSFSPITSGIIDRSTPSLKQLILCSATIPRSLDAYINKRYPDTVRLASPNVHAIPRRVQLGTIDIDKMPFHGNRDLACAQTIWDIGRDVSEPGEERVKKIIVFVNEREKTEELATYLRSKGIDGSALSRDSSDRNQADTLAEFTGAPVTAAIPKGAVVHSGRAKDDVTAGTPKRTLPNTKVLVMTDIGSRGIDTLLVRHVILYDVPHTSIDFIHRLGRVGRMGRRGRGVVLVGKHDRKDIVKEIRDGMFRGQALI